MTMREELNGGCSDEENLIVLYNVYAAALKRKANSILKDNGWAEDAVQTTFMKIMSHMDKVKEPFSNGTRYYLYTTLINTCYTLLKKNNRYYFMDDDTLQNDYGVYLSKRDNSVDHLICEDLVNDILSIPASYSTLLILYVVYNYSLTEISVMLEMKPATVRKRIQRARQMLTNIKEKYKP